MRCKFCNARLADHDIWCVECGKQTTVPGRDLSALASLKSTWQSFKTRKSESVPSGALALFLGIVPMILLTWLFKSYIQLPSETGIQVILSSLIKALSYSIFMPFILVSFACIQDRSIAKFSHVDYLRALRSYPGYFVFSLLTTSFLVLIHVICFGLPKFGSDPILRLVWIVLINYWAAITMPAAALMGIKNASPIKATSLSYSHFHDVRWNIWLLALILVLINGLAAVLALVGLVITLPLSWFVIRDYTWKLVDFELLEYRR